MGDFTKMSEDEEDLEALRLAALQSLKKKSQMNETNQFMNNFSKNRRGKFYRPNQNRNPRNGQLNNWTRNSNLIAVPVISNDDPIDDDAKRLILPQDRYHRNKQNNNDNNDESTSSPLSKFDRYDNSDRSDSDTDDDSNDSGDKDVLKRSNSLEALIEELENEINGESKKNDEKPSEKVKIKKKKRVENETTTTPTTTTITTTPTTVVTVSPTKTIAKENQQPDSSSDTKTVPPKKNFQKKKWTRTTPRRPSFLPKKDYHTQILPQLPQQSCNLLPQYPPTIPLQFPPIYNNQTYDLYQPPVNIYEPQHFTELPPRVPVYNQLSPLRINTDNLTTTMAPLSPRSAAFVLENRAIIEKRKRRSYSPSSRSSDSSDRLSLSPRYRRSKSRSPIKRPYSSKSPPITKRLPPPPPPPPPTTTIAKNQKIHERLGIKTDKDDKRFEDPIMEARRKKFESNQIVMKEGVIRLKAKSDDQEKQSQKQEKIDGNDDQQQIDNNDKVVNEDDDDIDEDALLDDVPDDDLEINPKFDVLFSDEESNSDNEGRFKIKQEQQQQNEKIVVMPFTKLINGTRSTLETKMKDTEKIDNKEKLKKSDNNDNSRGERRKRYRSKSPLSNQQQSSSPSSIASTSKKMVVKTKKSDKTISSSSSSSSNNNSSTKATNSFPIDNKKIEIKIRNPAKYEEIDDKTSKDNGRKVEIMAANTTNFENEQSNDSKDNPGKICEGDLRTQLSRKRAERQKQPLPDVVPSRLLQNALQSVGFEKGKKIQKIDKTDSKDGKLPIKLRLGTTTTSSNNNNNSSNGDNTDGFGKKVRKRGSLEQV